MRNLIIILVASSFILGCKNYKYLSKGYFDLGNKTGKESYFITDQSHLRSQTSPQNDLPKIFEGPNSYFVWNTVRYNKPIKKQVVKQNDTTYIDYGETFSSFKTLKNEDLKSLPPESMDYLIGERNILKNYLFFIDDYRCIYISEDDDRNTENLGPLYLMYNETYNPYKEINGSYKQMLRGYYTLKGDSIFIDFEFDKHFFIKGIVENNQKIKFKKIFVPAESRFKKAGINPTFYDFEDFISMEALPVFEKPNPNDIIVDQMFSLYFGFNPNRPDKGDYSSLHNQIVLKLGKDIGVNERYQILDIQYDFSDNFNPKRIYTFVVQDENGRQGQQTYQVEEPLALGYVDKDNFMNNHIRKEENKKSELKSLIDTW
ncbi:MAG: hypothetical protein R2784_11295 [Saprospiraceae bacterium]